VAKSGMSTLQRRRSPSNIASNSARPRRIRCAAQRLPNPVGDVRSGSIPVYGVSRSFRFPPKAAFQAFRPSRLANDLPQRIPVLKKTRTLHFFGQKHKQIRIAHLSKGRTGAAVTCLEKATGAAAREALLRERARDWSLREARRLPALRWWQEWEQEHQWLAPPGVCHANDP